MNGYTTKKDGDLGVHSFDLVSLRAHICDICKGRSGWLSCLEVSLVDIHYLLLDILLSILVDIDISFLLGVHLYVILLDDPQIVSGARGATGRVDRGAVAALLLEKS